MTRHAAKRNRSRSPGAAPADIRAEATRLAEIAVREHQSTWDSSRVLSARSTTAPTAPDQAHQRRQVPRLKRLPTSTPAPPTISPQPSATSQPAGTWTRRTCRPAR